MARLWAGRGPFHRGTAGAGTPWAPFEGAGDVAASFSQWIDSRAIDAGRVAALRPADPDRLGGLTADELTFRDGA
jgi:hypothetical protein